MGGYNAVIKRTYAPDANFITAPDAAMSTAAHRTRLWPRHCDIAVAVECDTTDFNTAQVGCRTGNHLNTSVVCSAAIAQCRVSSTYARSSCSALE